MLYHNYEQKTQLNNRQNDSKKIVTIVAYLVGIRMEILKTQYDNEVLEKIKDLLEVNIVRSLCKIRQALLENYKIAKIEICYHFKNIDNLNFIDAEDVAFLCKNNIPVKVCNWKNPQAEKMRR